MPGEGRELPAPAAGRAFTAQEARLPFPFNNSPAKLLPPLKFWILEVRREWSWETLAKARRDDSEDPVLGGWAAASPPGELFYSSR